MIFKKQVLFIFISLSLFFIFSCKKDTTLRNNPVKITARFVADKTNLKQGDLVNFTDSTIGFPLTWSWTFEGGVPNTSNQKNPENIKYNNLGEFSVTLVVTNAYGKDSIVRKSFIKVLRELLVPTVETIEVFENNGLTLRAGGSLIDTGSATMIEMGLCWDTISEPTNNSFHTKIIICI